MCKLEFEGISGVITGRAIYEGTIDFRQAQAAEGVVRWPNGADLAPDAMYDAIRAAGRWVVP